MKRICTSVFAVLILLSCSKKNTSPTVDLVEKDTLTNGWQLKGIDSNLNIWDMSFNGTQSGVIIMRNVSITGYDNLVYRTTNGGNNWTKQANLSRSYINISANNTFPFSFEKCFTRKDGVNFILATGPTSSILYKTVDFNTYDSTILFAELYSLNFIDNNNGYCSGFKRELGQRKLALYKTTNGGLSWTDLNITNIPSPIGTNPNFLISHFIDANTGWLATTSVYFSQGNDLNWLITQVTNTSNTALSSISAPTKNTVFVGTVSSEVFKSTNSGASFNKLNIPFFIPKSYTDVYFINDLVGYLVAYNKVLKSNDGGQTWKTEISLRDGRIYELFVIDENNCWVGGRAGVLVKLAR